MCQFTVYLNEDVSSNDTYPYFIDIQNSLLDDLNSRLVIPLSKQTSLNNITAKKLCPALQINNDVCFTNASNDDCSSISIENQSDFP